MRVSHKRVGAVVASVVAVALAIVPALAANAATIADKESIYIIDQAGRGIFETTSDGTATKVNVQIDPSFADIQSGAYDPVGKKFYVVDNTTLHLGIIDMLGGPMVDVGEVTFLSDALAMPYGLAFRADGSARLLIYNDDEGQWGVYDLDLSNGVLSNHGSWVSMYPDANQYPYGLGIDPTTGKEYFDTGNTVTYEATLVEFTPSSGETSNPALVTVPNPDDLVLWDGKFDSNGVFWFMLADCCAMEVGGTLFSWKPGEANATAQGTPVAAGLDISGPVVVGPSTASQLPDTGVSATTLSVIGSIGILLIAGGAVIVLRRRSA